jgi:ABC-type Fe3+ transport system substrate-binding protein
VRTNPGENEMLSRRTLVAAALALAAAPAVALDADWQAGPSEAWKKILNAARDEGTLVLGGPAPAADALSKGFTRDTGIAIQWLGGQAFEHAARVQTELRAGEVTVDVLVGGMAELAYVDQLKPLDDQLLLPTVTDAKYWRDGRIKYTDDARRRIIQGTEYVSGWLVANAQAVGPNDIKAWKDLLDPRYAGRIGSISPLVPSSAQSAARFLIDRFGTEFVKSLYLGQEVALTTDYNQVIEWLVRRKYDVVLGGVQANVEKFRAEGFGDAIRTILPADIPGYSTGGFSLIKMPQGLPHPNAATVFLNWYLSKPGQTAYSGAMLEPSRRLDVPARQDLDYLVLRPGVQYDDTYNEQSYRRGPKQIAALKALLQR